MFAVSMTKEPTRGTEYARYYPLLRILCDIGQPFNLAMATDALRKHSPPMFEPTRVTTAYLIVECIEAGWIKVVE